MKTCDTIYCDKCGSAMTHGYVIYEGLEHYCSEKCLFKAYTEAEYTRMFEEGIAYWTDYTDCTTEGE